MSEVRLIDANALIGFLHNQTFIDGDDRSLVYRWIEEQPTIEPEVRHGRWIEVTKHRDENGTILTDYECSECCAMVKDSDAEEIGSERFCYNCGADMREDGADNG